MTRICSIYPDSSGHMFIACLHELGSLSPSNQRSTDDLLNYGLDVSPRKHAIAPKN
jgi:hypothetical protein